MTNNSRYISVHGKSEWVYDPEQDSDTPRIVVTGRGEPYKTTSQSQVQRKQEQNPKASLETPQHQKKHQSNLTDQGTGEKPNDLGHVSNHWKNAIAALIIGSITFFSAGVMMVAFIYYTSELFLYAIGTLSVIYGVLRFILAYYVYKDAKAIRYHSQERTSKPWAHPEYGWQPKAVSWAFFVFMMPPFVEYGPMTVYMYRRHVKTGVP